MELRPIRTDEDHAAALHEIERLWDAPKGSDDAARLDALVTLVERYEERRWPVEPVSPVEAIRFSMEQNGRKQTDFALLLGSKSRASEILAGKRDLTVDQIKKLHREWRIPVLCLLGNMADA